MRRLVWAMMAAAAAGAATVATSAPAAAYDYPWCLQGRDTGYPGDCAYTNYYQCMASASGRFAYCGINPRVAFGAQRPPQPRGYYHHHHYSDYYR